MLDWAIVCLALNVYYEARGEPVEGQVAVALTTINRAKATQCELCDVVFHSDQFSWTVGWKKKKPTGPAWEKAMEVAIASLYMQDFTQGATHFHAEYVNPYWAEGEAPIGRWGTHLFYKRTDAPMCKPVLSRPAEPKIVFRGSRIP